MRIDELPKLAHGGWRSLCDGAGTEFYRQMMTEGAVMVLANGMVLDRNAVITSLNDAPAWRQYVISDERLIEIDDDTAILV
jgi:hypothetical protein